MTTPLLRIQLRRGEDVVLARRRTRQLAGYLGLDPTRFELALYSEADRPRLIDEAGRPVGGTAGLYLGGEHPTI